MARRLMLFLLMLPVVMLAPPNAGSELAEWLKTIWLFRTVDGPAGGDALHSNLNEAFEFGDR